MTLALLALSILLLCLDWSQTRYIAKHLDRFHETNVILGRAPTLSAVNAYFAACIAATAAGAWVFGAWVSVPVALLELVVTVRNYLIGVRMA